MTTVRRIPSVPQILQDAQDYLFWRGETLSIGKRLDRKKKSLKEWLQKNGVRDDDGNLKYPFPKPIMTLDEKVYAGVMLRRTQGTPYLDEGEVRDFLVRKSVANGELTAGPMLRRAFKTVEVLVPDELYVMQQEGVITEDELRALLHDPEPSYALWPYEVTEELEEDDA